MTTKTSWLNAHDGKSLRTVRAEHKDAFDVAGAARSGDEGDKARIVVAVFALQQLEGRGQIRQQLFAPGDDHMVWRQHRKRATARAAAGDEDAARLCDERVAFRDPDVARFQFIHVVSLVGAEHWQTERLAGGIRQLTGMRGGALPALRVAQLAQQRRERGWTVEPMEVRFQFRGVGAKERNPVVECWANGRQPVAGAGGGGAR